MNTQVEDERWERVIFPARFAALVKRQPLDVVALEQCWQEERENLALAMHGVQIPVGEHIYHPHLSALEAFIKNAWDDLADDDVFQEALSYFTAMQDDPLATVLGLEEFRVALAMGGERTLLKQVADLEQQYMWESPFWHEFLERVQRGTNPYAVPGDYVPGSTVGSDSAPENTYPTEG